MLRHKLLTNILFRSSVFGRVSFQLMRKMSTAQKTCLYKILNVSTEASPEEIKKSYLDLAKKYHPDVSKGEVAQEEKFKEVSQAYQILSDPDKRKKYDLDNGIANF
jgi:DnaJ-class molecular chaperone